MDLLPHDLIVELADLVRSYGADSAVVALSGGVDSGVVTAVAARALGGGRVLAVTAVSPSYPSGELATARDLAAVVGVEHQVIETGEVDRDAYARNDGLRCYHCKIELYAALERVAVAHTGSGAVILAGANAEDAEDFRPGLRAARQRGIRNPLLELGIRKGEVRAIARHMGLPVADKPAMACLSSRVAFGVRITPGLLARIDRAEREIQALGFTAVRVRHFGERASIEVDHREVHRLRSHPGLPSLMDRLAAMGWDEVEVAPEGYRPGRMNATLTLSLMPLPPRIAAGSGNGPPG